MRPLYVTAYEECLLGGLMLDGTPEAFSRISGLVAAGDFFHKRHQLIFSAITELAAADQQHDAIDVAEVLEQHDQLFDIGGLKYLVKLVGETASTAHLEWHAQRVAELAKKRRIVEVAGRIAAGDFDLLPALIQEAA